MQSPVVVLGGVAVSYERGTPVGGRGGRCAEDHTLDPNTKSYRGASLIRNSAPLAPYSRTMPRALGGPRGGGCCL